jgi:glutamyl-tRNA synthetase
MVNFLALLGWSPGNDQELFTIAELVQAFSLDGIGTANAVFNPEKLEWMNSQHLMRMDTREIARRVEPLLREAGLWDDTFATERLAWLGAVLDLLRPRARRLRDFLEKGRLFLVETIVYDEAAVQKHLRQPGMPDLLRALRDAYAALPTFSREPLEAGLRALADSRGVKPAALIHAARVAVTGTTVSPGLFETLELLGRDRVLARLAEGAQHAPRDAA